MYGWSCWWCARPFLFNRSSFRRGSSTGSFFLFRVFSPLWPWWCCNGVVLCPCFKYVGGLLVSDPLGYTVLGYIPPHTNDATGPAAVRTSHGATACRMVPESTPTICVEHMPATKAADTITMIELIGTDTTSIVQALEYDGHKLLLSIFLACCPGRGWDSNWLNIFLFRPWLGKWLPKPLWLDKPGHAKSLGYPVHASWASCWLF